MNEADFWDGLAEQYAAKPVEDVAAWEKKKAYLKPLIGPTDVVLDIGCGTGSLAIELAPLAAAVHAQDLSPNMIAIGERKRQAAGCANLTFHTGSFRTFDALPPGGVDVVCAFSILHLVPDRVATLASIHDLLRPGGRFISSTVVLANSWMPYGPLLTVMRWAGKAPPVTLLSTDGLMNDLRQAGFADVAAVDVGADHTTAFLSATKPRPLPQ